MSLRCRTVSCDGSPPAPPPRHAVTSPFFIPLQIEDAKRCLFLYGNQTSQVIKDVITDLYQLKRVSAVLAVADGVAWGRRG